MPFTYPFVYLMLALEITMITHHEKLHRYIKTIHLDQVLKFIFISIPLLYIIYYDIQYKALSLNKLFLLPKKYNNAVNYIFTLFGSYGMIQVLGQDSGLKTGTRQRDAVQQSFFFAIIALGMAFSVTRNRSQAFIAVLSYFHFKFVISNNKTSKVCVEDV